MRLHLVTRAPEIETPRLLLRGHRLDDLADCVALWGDPRVTKHIGGKPSSQQESWARLLRYVGHWELLGFGFWVVLDKSSRQFVGEVGFADFKRTELPAFEGAPEAGWVLAPHAWRKGFATEAVRAAHDWLESVAGPVRTVCLIEPDNAPSIRVAERCGYAEWTQASLSGCPMTLYDRFTSTRESA